MSEMNEDNKMDDLRVAMARLLESDETSSEVRDLLRELNVYQTELEQKNKELSCSVTEYAETRAEYVDLFENAPVGYAVIDEAHNIHKLNQTFIEDFVPVDNREISYVGHPFVDFLYPESRQLFYLFCNMLQKPGFKAPLEIKLYGRFQVPVHAAITAGKYRPDAKLFHLAITDISQLKHRETRYVQAKENAEEECRQKSRFWSGVNHELRTSLSTVIGYCDLFGIADLSPDDRKNCINSIQVSGKMLMSLTEEVMDLSLLESGRIPMSCDNVDVTQICKEAVSFAQTKTKNKLVQIECEVNDIPILWADQLRLRQIISSVMNHAAGNATEGTVFLRGRFDQVDSISGVLIFNIFGHNIFSGENELEYASQRMLITRNYAARGLYGTSQIVKAMDGKMFWIHPLDSLRIEIPLKITQNGSLLQDEGTEKSLVDGAARKCLLVDDVSSNLAVLEATMKQLGFVPTSASSGKEALSLLATERFDLIMTDLWMPNMNGEELARMIRQNPDYNDIPIYAVTADVDCDRNFNMRVFQKSCIKPVNMEKISELLTPVKW